MSELALQSQLRTQPPALHSCLRAKDKATLQLTSHVSRTFLLEANSRGRLHVALEQLLGFLGMLFFLIL